MPDAPSGVIAGGWSYVIAAYSITAAALTVYVWRLRRRLAAPGDSADDLPAKEDGR